LEKRNLSCKVTWHDIKKERPKLGTQILVINTENYVELCWVSGSVEGLVFVTRHSIFNIKRVKLWTDIDSLKPIETKE